MAKVSSAREDMLSAAVELFGARGYEGVGVAELLKKSGAPRGSLYFHFPGGKQQIGAEVVKRVGETVAMRFRALSESGVDLTTLIDQVFKTTAKESKERCYTRSCPMAAIATGFGDGDELLATVVRDAFNSWEIEIQDAAGARGMSAANAKTFASAMLAAMEGAFIISKAQRSSAAHINAGKAMKALALSLTAN
ncbi:MAG: TetR/AcrR family transcriptional regulator [Hyphomonadaceae bacterium]